MKKDDILDFLDKKFAATTSSSKKKKPKKKRQEKEENKTKVASQKTPRTTEPADAATPLLNAMVAE